MIGGASTTNSTAPNHVESAIQNPICTTINDHSGMSADYVSAAVELPMDTSTVTRASGPCGALARARGPCHDDATHGLGTISSCVIRCFTSLPELSKVS